MAKVSRSVLKEIVKECLVEILSEGLHSSTENIQEAKTKKQRRKVDRVAPEVFEKRNRMLREKTERRAPSVNVNAITDDPMMQEIFADTAATTLQSQPITESGTSRPDYVQRIKLQRLFLRMIQKTCSRVQESGQRLHFLMEKIINCILICMAIGERYEYSTLQQN